MRNKGLLLALLPSCEAFAKQDYTYVQSSLAFPWFMFFVFFALILIPYLIVIVLAWRSSASDEETASALGNSIASTATVKNQTNIFNRFVLPALLFIVGIFSVLLVMNAYEAMDLMEQFGTAAPTMLNARP